MNNNSQSSAIRSPVYGPFEVIGELTADGRELLSLPFAAVAGCNLIVAVADNFANPDTEFHPNFLWPGVEVSIWGAIQNFPSCLRRICLHMQTGPVAQKFDYEDGWDTVSVHAQNMCGGSVVNIPGVQGPPTQARGFSLKVTVYVMPRSGFASPAGNTNYGRPG